MPSSPDGTVLGVRRSRRLAAKAPWSPTPCKATDAAPPAPMPPTPRLDASPPRFTGPPPTWITHTESSSTLQPRRGTAPRADPAWDPSVLDAMPQSSHAAGLAIRPSASPRHARHYSESHNTISASPTSAAHSPLSTSVSSPRLGAEDWPLDEPLAKSVSPPGTPLVGVLENGVFPTVELPSPPHPLVAHDDPHAEPVSYRTSAMERSTTMRRELPLASPSSLPRIPGVVGLGIDMDGGHAMDRVSSKLATLTIDPSRRPLADRGNAPIRVPLSEKSHKPLAPRAALSDKQAARTAPKALPVTAPASLRPDERLDENGQPCSVPTSRTLPAPSMARSASFQRAPDRNAVRLSHTGHGAPFQVHTRPVYSLR